MWCEGDGGHSLYVREEAVVIVSYSQNSCTQRDGNKTNGLIWNTDKELINTYDWAFGA